MVLVVAVLMFYGIVLFSQGKLRGLWAQHGKPSVREKVGIYAVERQLRRDAPIGRGVTFGHVEGNAGDYLPDLKNRRFRGVKTTARSGTSKVNGHALATANKIYGRNGLAPGVRDVYFYTTNYWLRQGVIKAGTGEPPDPDGRRVFTHSWIGYTGRYAANTLRRIDYLIDQHDVLMTVGVNNGSHSKVPALLGSAYNVIAVGVTSGNSSGGYTTFETAGRCKPDIVAPQPQTSFSTPVVASVIARLLEAADRMDADRMDGTVTASRSEVIKAVLMAGASKPKGWQPQPGKPLDEHLGAGTVRFDHSYQILTAGPVMPGRVTAPDGWDLRSLPGGGQASYTFDAVEPTGPVSVMLVWNRRIDGRQVTDLFTQRTRWLDEPRLADFDLRLVHMDDQGQENMVAESASGIDNVEHLYTPSLASGRYTLTVSRKEALDEAWDYAVAWRIEPPTTEDLE